MWTGMRSAPNPRPIARLISAPVIDLVDSQVAAFGAIVSRAKSRAVAKMSMASFLIYRVCTPKRMGHLLASGPSQGRTAADFDAAVVGQHILSFILDKVHIRSN